MRQAYIFVPVAAFTLLVFVLWMHLGFARVSAARRGAIPMEYLAQGTGPGPSRYLTVLHHHFSNLWEIPVLFYAGCISLYVLGGVDPLSAWLAWGFVLLRLVHTAIVLINNSPPLRVGPYVLSGFCVFGLWAQVLMRAMSSET